jgi:hypothetical protein
MDEMGKKDRVSIEGFFSGTQLFDVAGFLAREWIVAKYWTSSYRYRSKFDSSALMYILVDTSEAIYE